MEENDNVQRTEQVDYMNSQVTQGIGNEEEKKKIEKRISMKQSVSIILLVVLIFLVIIFFTI